VNLLKRFVREDNGADTVEYALVLGLVALAAVVGITSVGTNLQTWWNGLGTTVGGLPGA
jgi:pilus assembly protein Flp/PilA